MKSNKILLVAGEVSGDLHGSYLLEAVHEIDPEVEFFGIGGENLKKKGMRLLYHLNSLSVVGVTEAIFKLKEILSALKEVKNSILREKPNLIILIDFPEFNLRVARMAQRRGISVLYYISPQLWAWRPKRIKTIARCVKKMVVFFPFEVPLYKRAGVDVEWVGHPMLDIVKPTYSKEEAIEIFGIQKDRRTIGLLPGSRIDEIKRLMPVLLRSAHILQNEMPDLQFIIPLAHGISEGSISPWMKNAPISVRVIKGFTYDVMNISDLLITASGTATLEGAILEKPMIIIYKVSWFSYLIGRALINVDHIGLVNLVSGREVSPELIQGNANPEKIAKEALRILRDPNLLRKMTDGMSALRQGLGEPGAVKRAAKIVTSLLPRANYDTSNICIS